ncbi:YheC/YheD family protein [Ammoniphilus sp. YIM 78166]|uniref:YheC/YheD family endospore coat-associated protein n=1 Tax=Ammoniphilus sp. YIM 78166 TaxID=1644106 RepID=UPI0014315D10|nr:YheC/YheD family protein [Ammoniphilus sp. YIM 78166]
MSDAWLGILVNDSLWKGIPKGRTGQEKIEFYLEAARNSGIKPCFFRLGDISCRFGKVKALVNSGGKWKQRVIPIPRVIHNRAIFDSQVNYKRCERLKELGIVLFNFWNRYSKLEITEILAQNDQLKPYLPYSTPFSLAHLSTMGQQFPSVMLKPDRGTVGEGIVKIDRVSPLAWNLKFRSGKQLKSQSTEQRELYSKLKKITGKNRYLLQETIDLATYKECPFDIRVSVQKDGTGEWSVTGMVGKVARPGHFLSNVAQGGSVHSLEELFEGNPELSPIEVEKKLEEVALLMVQYLEEKLPYLADVGFDFGIDKKGQPFFIEMNGRDQRYSFAKGDMMDTWKRTYEKPVAYAKFLLDKQREGLRACQEP